MALPTIFRQYIGSKPYPNNFDDFPDVINPRIKEFHFIIAFASEAYDESGKGTGKFKTNWIVPAIDSKMIQNLKNKYEYESVNVQVMISIGGRGPEYPFNPADKETWPDNARDSLTGIIGQLGNLIDGIDINYDSIHPGNEKVFSDCIGKLINSLKNESPLVSVVSIAPSGSYEAPYHTLFSNHKNDIDWVNYKFYTLKIPSNVVFEREYRRLAKIYGQKLLAGFSTDPADAGNLPLVEFFKACENLIKSGELRGIFNWNANDSQLEKRAQQLLIKN